jgi:hypothetical protein
VLTEIRENPQNVLFLLVLGCEGRKEAMGQESQEMQNLQRSGLSFSQRAGKSSSKE